MNHVIAKKSWQEFACTIIYTQNHYHIQTKTLLYTDKTLLCIHKNTTLYRQKHYYVHTKTLPYTGKTITMCTQKQYSVQTKTVYLKRIPKSTEY